MFRRCSRFAVLSFCAVALPVFASVTGTITGRVLDAGEYSLLSLPVGHYSLQVAAPGFASFQEQNIVINARRRLCLERSICVNRPFSSRTKYEEDAHRGYVDAGYRESRDLLRVGMDRVAELIKTEKAGVAVFNSESWERDGFFDAELGSDEALEDPADGSLLPCGSLKAGRP